MKKWRKAKIACGAMLLLLLACAARAEVRIFAEDWHGKARIRYACTAGEVVRAFALDVTVNSGMITNISDFFRGPCTSTAQGYGIFPASLRDHIVIQPDASIDWNVSAYTPVATPPDVPGETQPGLYGAGITLEFGAVWDPEDPATLPPSSGVLCSLAISCPAQVSVSLNRARGGVSPAAQTNLELVFTSARVDPSPFVTGAVLKGGEVQIIFKGGELESSSALTGPWIPTGNDSGMYSEPLNPATCRFFRVSHF